MNHPSYRSLLELQAQALAMRLELRWKFFQSRRQPLQDLKHANTGITLEVEPVVGPNKKYIELSLRPELVEFEGFVNYGSPIATLTAGGLGSTESIEITKNNILMPIFKTIRMPNAALTIQDGATVVIGGLITSKKIKVEDKTPILGDIPFAGRLFRSEASQTIREAIIITVNAELVDPTGQPWRNR